MGRFALIGVKDNIRSGEKTMGESESGSEEGGELIILRIPPIRLGPLAAKLRSFRPLRQIFKSMRRAFCGELSKFVFRVQPPNKTQCS